MLNSDLYKKYNVAGPRYTSYPTVPYWETNPTPTEWMDSILLNLEEAKAQKVGAAIYMHIPFCESLCTYCGCNTRITRKRDVGSPYVDTVLKEWGLYLDKIGKGMPLSEMHLGGGTPTFLTVPELEKLVGTVLSSVHLTAENELSLEADPRVTSREQLASLYRMGFRRLSLGIQDFDPKVQETVQRVQSELQVRRITETARELGYTSVNYDLIYGLPFQTQKSIHATIDVVRAHRPDRIAFYAYAHVPWIRPGQRRFTEDDLPAAAEKRALYELGRKLLEETGYREVGMDHFVLETDSMWTASRNETLHRNFMGYTARQVTPLIGLGVSSIGDSWRIFAQNEKVLEAYTAKVQAGELPIQRGHKLDAEDLVLRRHILNIMTHLHTEWSDPALQTPFLKEVPARLVEMKKDGLLDFDERGCRVHESGRAFLRNICMAFDARLIRKAPATQLFSQTI